MSEISVGFKQADTNLTLCHRVDYIFADVSYSHVLATRNLVGSADISAADTE